MKKKTFTLPMPMIWLNKAKFGFLLLFALSSLSILFSQCTKSESKMEYSISMDKPSTHLFHITFRYEGINSPSVDCKLPVWTPGYYLVTNFPKNVLSFTAENENGKSLEWAKTDKNTWRIKTEKVKTIIVKYDVYSFSQSVADPFLDAGRAFIPPASVFMFVDGQLKHPVTVNVQPYKEWKKISTGLDIVSGKPNTFFAENFDVLYDSPILVGNQKIVSFDVKGIPHHIAMEFPEEFDTTKVAIDYKKIVEASELIMGDIPYKNYTFLVMGEGRGGLEHSNSMAVYSNGRYYNAKDEKGYKRWLSFIAHEYFHLFNIKRIRPINIGPFDYNKENYTNMLWVSEGGTVYYEYMVLNKAGLLSQTDFFESVEDGIKNYEGIPGHLFQSATESSFDTWIKFFGRNENTQNTTISYYDKGFALCLLLDLKIRHETNSKKSLDDVMRTLYNKYHIEMGRGFTDDEFRVECEKIAGCSLDEIFTYASTVNNIDYPKYFEYAGLAIDTTAKEVPGCWLGTNVREQGNSLTIWSVEWNSPAYNAGLSAQDTILEIDGKKVDYLKFMEIIRSHKKGEEIKLLIANRTQKGEVKVTLGAKLEKSFKITKKDNPTPQQKELLENWLR